VLPNHPITVHEVSVQSSVAMLKYTKWEDLKLL